MNGKVQPEFEIRPTAESVQMHVVKAQIVQALHSEVVVVSDSELAAELEGV